MDVKCYLVHLLVAYVAGSFPWNLPTLYGAVRKEKMTEKTKQKNKENA